MKWKLNRQDCGFTCTGSVMLRIVSCCLHHSNVSLTFLCIAYHTDVSLDLTDLWEAVVKFMESSSVGDFGLRLKMMKSFHEEMTTVNSTFALLG